uniref:Uncharacterized protein n=1 Tax=Anguilla anguilla TaxID=7936 RepID=A0A0E9WE21_ANGAN
MSFFVLNAVWGGRMRKGRVVKQESVGQGLHISLFPCVKSASLPKNHPPP